MLLKNEKKRRELYNKVMELRKRTGWGRVKIARELGISANTVGNWLYSKSKGRKYHRDWESSIFGLVIGINSFVMFSISSGSFSRRELAAWKMPKSPITEPPLGEKESTEYNFMLQVNGGK